MVSRIRRIVTGEPGPGTEAVFTHVEEVEPLVVGRSKTYWVWGHDEVPSLPYASTAPYEPYSMFPPPGGTRVTVVAFPPQEEGISTPADSETPAAELRRRLQQAVPHGRLTGSKPTMHRTDTVDIGFVLSGEVIVELEGGEEQAMTPGDVYIQHGAMHAWRNDGAESAVVAFVNLPARRREL